MEEVKKRNEEIKRRWAHPAVNEFLRYYRPGVIHREINRRVSSMDSFPILSFWKERKKKKNERKMMDRSRNTFFPEGRKNVWFEARYKMKIGKRIYRKTRRINVPFTTDTRRTLWDQWYFFRNYLFTPKETEFNLDHSPLYCQCIR